MWNIYFYIYMESFKSMGIIDKEFEDPLVFTYYFEPD